MFTHEKFLPYEDRFRKRLDLYPERQSLGVGCPPYQIKLPMSRSEVLVDLMHL